MWSFCSIKSCFSKSFKSGKCHTSNSVAMFSTPSKCTENYQKWLDAIRPHVKEELRNRKRFNVCQYHFEDCLLLKEDIKIWKDGAEVTIPRKKVQLRKTAIPTIFNVANRTLETLQNSKELVENKVNALEVAQNPNFENDNKHPILRTKLTNTENKTIPSDNNQHNAVKKVYSQEDLISDWKNPSENFFLKDWDMAVFPDSSIFIRYRCNSTKETEMRSVIVEGDMTTTLYVYGRASTYEILKKITCFEDLSTILCTLLRLKVCENVSCSDGYFQPKSHSPSKKCSSCQSEQRREYFKEKARKRREALKACGKKNKRSCSSGNVAS